MNKKPFISVLVSTYNHARYLSQALNSILEQDAPPFEIVIADDCSTDDTVKIIHSYIERFPDQIVQVPATQNVGSLNNLKRSFAYCSGNYIAILEGDDFWLSPYKLRRQYEFLEVNPECSMCFNALITLNENEQFKSHTSNKFKKIKFETRDLAKENFIGNFSTCMYRRASLENLDPKIYNLYGFDWLINLCISEQGPIGYLPQQMTAYRLHEQGQWTQLTSKERSHKILKAIEVYDSLFQYKYHAEFMKMKQDLLIEISSRKKTMQILKNFAKDFLPPVILNLYKQLRGT